MTVKIPAGIGDGKKLRVRGKGNPSPYGGPPGDLYLVISTRPHPRFERDGADLTTTAEVPFSTAALGGETEVTDIEGKVLKLRVPAGCKNGARLRIKGRGMKKTGGRGDLYVRIVPAVPASLTAEQKDLLRKLAATGM